MAYKVVARSVRDGLGEGPVWDEKRGELIWVDITAPRVNRLSLETGCIKTLTVDEPIGWVLPRRDASDHVVGFRSGFHYLNIETGERRFIGNPEQDRPDNRLNDGKVDPFGRIWAGSKHDHDGAASGALYRLDPTLAWTRCDDGYGVANGPTFSPDGRILYHTDSALRTIYAFDLTDNGEITNRRIWRVFEEEWGYPDGMTTDKDGCLWVAHWGGGRISRFAPHGTLLQAIHLPTINITSCAFAGKRLDRMFVTSSTIGCETEPFAGALFEVRPTTVGLATSLFAG